MPNGIMDLQLNRFRFAIFALFLIGSFHPILPQKPASELGTTLQLATAEQNVNVWRTRVDYLSSEISKESTAVSSGEQAMYMALLAKIWWKTDEVEARSHLRKAADALRKVFDPEEKVELEKQLRFWRKTVQLISALDEKLAHDLIGQLESAVDNNDDENRKPNKEMADLFAAVGLEVVKSNPRMALACGMDSLLYGFGDELPALIVEINLRDPGLAEVLIRQALLKAKNNYSGPSYLLLFNLNRYMIEFNKGRPFSNLIHGALVEAFSDMLAGAVSLQQEMRTRCSIAWYAPSFLSQVARYLPGRSVTFRNDLNTCLQYSNSPLREKIRAEAADELKDVDDILRAARIEKDIEAKIAYYRKAMSQLQSDKKFDEMISVLDGLDGDDFKKAAPGGWDLWRIDAAARATLKSFEANDLPAVYRIIARAPKRLRPHIRYELVSSPGVARNKELFLENLDEMQKELASIEIAPEEAAPLYLELAHFYLVGRPTDAESMFRLAARNINKADAENPNFLPDKDWAPHEDYVKVKSDLLEIDESSIVSSLNSISSRRSRVRLKLGLLESSLSSFSEAKKKLAALKKEQKPPGKRI